MLSHALSPHPPTILYMYFLEGRGRRTTRKKRDTGSDIAVSRVDGVTADRNPEGL
jgi:hypothetical protein